MEKTLVIPNAFSDASKRPQQRPYRAECQACGDFGTILLGGATREPRTLPEIMQHEAPCTCRNGDFWRKLFAKWGQHQYGCDDHGAA